MVGIGDLLGRVVAESITLLEGTLAHYVNITSLDGNITNISLSANGEAFCQNWANLLVSFAGALNAMMTALWTTTT